jgi:hypothetical protein
MGSWLPSAIKGEGPRRWSSRGSIVFPSQCAAVAGASNSALCDPPLRDVLVDRGMSSRAELAQSASKSGDSFSAEGVIPKKGSNASGLQVNYATHQLKVPPSPPLPPPVSSLPRTAASQR